MSGLICDECGLPAVPFGGEYICMGHDEERERDTWPDDDGEEESNDV